MPNPQDDRLGPHIASFAMAFHQGLQALASARMPVSCRGAPSSDEQAPNSVVGDCPSRLCPARQGAHHAEAPRGKLLVRWRLLWQYPRAPPANFLQLPS